MKKILFLFSLLAYCAPCSSATDAGNSIKGMVTDSLKNPIAGAIISIDSTAFRTMADAKGYFYLLNISDGQHPLVVKALGFVTKRLTVTLNGGQLVDLGTIVLQETSLSLSDVTVIGETSGEARAINLTKTSPQLVTVTSSEEIEKLPNKNAADAVSHNPGVATQRNKGENNVISIRGTPSDWSSVLVNGDRLPVACEENTTRSFEFEAFPATLIDHVVESRTITPAMESDNIGGSMNFVTRFPEYKKQFTVNAASGVNAMAGKSTGMLDVLWGSVSKNKKLSFIVNASDYSRYYAADAEKIIYGSNFHHGINRLELRRYDGFRNTIGGNIGIEYKFSSSLKIGAQHFSGFMRDNKGMKKQSFNWFEDSGQRIRLQNTFGIQDRLIMGTSLYAEFSPGQRFRLKARAASYTNEFRYGPFPNKNKNDPRNGLYVMEFISPSINYTDLSRVDMNGNAIDPNSLDYILIKLAGKDNPYMNAGAYTGLKPVYTNILTSQDFQYAQSYTEGNHTRESDPIVAQIDGEYKLNNYLLLQVGGKYRNKSGYRRITKHEWFQKFSSGTMPILLTDFQTQAFSPDNSRFLREHGINYQDLLQPFLGPDAIYSFVKDYEEKLREVYMNKLNPDYRLWVGSNYAYNEQQAGAYTQLDYSSRKLHILGGIRCENTRLSEESDTLTGKIAFDTATSVYYYIPEKRYSFLNYTAALPSINCTYYIRENINLRLAVSRTMHRPNFEETKPGHAVIRYNDLEYTFGNPKLKPATSVNVDMCLEYFFGARGMWSLGSYYKKINDHIFASTTPGVDPASGIVIKQYDNAPNSWILGFEGIFIRRFDFLRGFWNGFGVSTNVSYSISQMQVPGRPKSQPMTGQTPLLFNFSVLYKKKQFDSRLALGYNSGYLTQLNLAAVMGTGLIHKDSDYDLYMDKYYSLDYQISYEFRKKYTVYIEATNLLNSPEKKYIGQSWRASSVEYYRFKAQVGFKFSLDKSGT